MKIGKSLGESIIDIIYFDHKTSIYSVVKDGVDISDGLKCTVHLDLYYRVMDPIWGIYTLTFN